jgi:hypothetical protein
MSAKSEERGTHHALLDGVAVVRRELEVDAAHHGRDVDEPREVRLLQQREERLRELGGAEHVHPERIFEQLPVRALVRPVEHYPRVVLSASHIFR